MSKIVIDQLIGFTQEKWEPRDVAFVNDTALRICKVDGAYEWHTHQNEDELFLVVKGCVFIDTEEGTVELNQNEGYLVKKGVRHRSRTLEPAWVLLVEPTRTKTLGR